MKIRDWQVITIISDEVYEEVDCNSGDRRTMHKGGICFNCGETKPCAHTDLGPVCSDACENGLFSRDNRADRTPCATK